jgi:glycosyltransferase involved in cell wall biosynthesis
MKIGISAFAADGGKSGIGQYILNVITRLPACCSDAEIVVFAPNRDRNLYDLEQPRITYVFTSDFVSVPIVNILWHLIVFPILLRRHRIDCAYMPAGNRRLSLFYGVPSVATVHDFSQLHVQRKYDRLRMFYVNHVLPFFVRRLDKIVSVSISTSRDLVEHARVEEEKIRVVYNGTDTRRFLVKDKSIAAGRVASELSIVTPYILYTARLEHPGKNHVRLIEAFARLKRRNVLEHQLVLAGSRWNGSDVIEEAVRQSGLQDEILLPGFVPDSLLPDLYSAADLFVFPSLFEGFGIPLVEAMRCGIPVCAANISSIPEVVGDAAILFDPYNIEEITEAMQRGLSDYSFRSTMVSRGLAQARRFTWEGTASDVFHTCLEAARA